MKKGLLVRYISPEAKLLSALGQGLLGLVSMFISLLMLVQFYQFTLLKFVAWLLPLAALARLLARLWQTGEWRYRRFLWRFRPATGWRGFFWFSLPVPIFWFLIWQLVWPQLGWLGAWQYVGGELLLSAIAAYRAPAGYYELASGAWLGLSERG